MKFIFLIYWLFATFASADDDPFSDVYGGKTAKSASWEKMLVDDTQYHGEVVLIDGFIKIEKYENNSFKYYLFIDSESLKYSRAKRCIQINSEKLDSILSQNIGMNSNDKLNLNGKYVKIMGVYQKPEHGGQMGSLRDPISLYFKEGEVNLPKNGVVHVK